MERQLCTWLRSKATWVSDQTSVHPCLCETLSCPHRHSSSRLVDPGFSTCPFSHLSNRLMNRDAGVVKALLEGGAVKAATNKDGKTPMDFAKLAHQDEVMKLLA